MSVVAPAGKARRTTSGTVLEVHDLHVTFPSRGRTGAEPSAASTSTLAAGRDDGDRR